MQSEYNNTVNWIRLPRPITELKPKMAVKRQRDWKRIKNEFTITINVVTYCLVFLAKSFISFNHGFWHMELWRML